VTSYEEFSGGIEDLNYRSQFQRGLSAVGAIRSQAIIGQNDPVKFSDLTIAVEQWPLRSEDKFSNFVMSMATYSPSSRIHETSQKT